MIAWVHWRTQDLISQINVFVLTLFSFKHNHKHSNPTNNPVHMARRLRNEVVSFRCFKANDLLAPNWDLRPKAFFMKLEYHCVENEVTWQTRTGWMQEFCQANKSTNQQINKNTATLALAQVKKLYLFRVWIQIYCLLACLIDWFWDRFIHSNKRADATQSHQIEGSETQQQQQQQQQQREGWMRFDWGSFPHVHTKKKKATWRTGQKGGWRWKSIDIWPNVRVRNIVERAWTSIVWQAVMKSQINAQHKKWRSRLSNESKLKCFLHPQSSIQRANMYNHLDQSMPQ